MRHIVRLGVILLVMAAGVSAQSLVSVQGRVVDVTSAWATTDYGDQRIVSTVTVRTAVSDLVTEVTGGTIDGLTLEVSDVAVPKVGEIVRLRHSRGRWRIEHRRDDFTLSEGGGWLNGVMAWVLDPTNNDMDPALAERDLIDAAQAWTVQSTADLAMTYAGRISAGSGVQVKDFQNTVFFRPITNPENSSAIASTYCWWSNGYRLDCDVTYWDGKARFLAREATCSGTSPSYLIDIATHEFGHVAGLKHSSVSGATMYPSYSYCSTSFRTLALDDIAGIEALYPVSAPAPEPEPTPDPEPNPCKKRGRWAC